LFSYEFLDASLSPLSCCAGATWCKAVRADRHAPNAEPQPRREIPTAPDHLTPDARIAWERLAPRLARMGVLATSNALTLERAREVYSEIRRCMTVLEAAGHTYETLTVT
jgi:phage terminase small subunit